MNIETAWPIWATMSLGLTINSIIWAGNYYCALIDEARLQRVTRSDPSKVYALPYFVSLIAWLVWVVPVAAHALITLVLA